MEIITKVSEKLATSVGIVLFSLGLVGTMAAAFIAFWPNMEASMFDTTTTAQERLRTLSCPRVITADEEAVIRLTLENPFDDPLRLQVRARISEGYLSLSRQYSQFVELAPRETRDVTWDISAEDAVFNRVVMARVFVNRRPPLPSRQAACGTLVLPLNNLSGNQIVFGSLLLGLAGFGASGATLLWHKRPFNDRKLRRVRAAAGLAGLVLLNLIFSMMGYWLVGVLLSLLMLVYLGAIIEHLWASR